MITLGAWIGVIATRVRAPAPGRSCGQKSTRGGSRAVLVASAMLSLDFAAAFAESAANQPTSATIECPAPGQQLFANPPELRSAGGILKGTIVLKEEERQRLPASRAGNVTCSDVRVRSFRGETAAGEGLPPMPPAQPPSPGLSDPAPGPTLRARVGDLVQLTLVNEVNPNNFDPNIDFECTEVGEGGRALPQIVQRYFPQLFACLEHGQHPFSRNTHQSQLDGRQCLPSGPATTA